MSQSIPFDVPILLQSKNFGNYLQVEVKKKNDSVHDIGTNCLIKFYSFEKNKVAIQSLYSGKFLCPINLIFRHETLEQHRLFSFCVNNRELIIIGQNKQCVCGNYDYFLKFGRHDDMNAKWLIVFPTTPFIKLLNHDSILYSSPSTDYKPPCHIPLYLRAYNKGYLAPYSEKGYARAVTLDACPNVEIVLHSVEDRKVAIESRHTKLFLSAEPTGKCTFQSQEIGDTELFTFKFNETKNAINFYSYLEPCGLFWSVSGNVFLANNDEKPSGDWLIYLAIELGRPISPETEKFYTIGYYDH